MKNLTLLMLGILIFQASAQASSILCETRPEAVSLNRKNEKTINAGMLYGGIKDAQDACMKQGAPADIPCDNKCSGPTVISRNCRLKMFPGQTDAQASTDKNDPALMEPGRTSTLNYIVPETSFLCDSGQETCGAQRQLGPSCANLRRAVAESGKDWQSRISTNTPEFKKWNNTYCASPNRALTKITMKEAKCLGDQIIDYPKVEVQTYCIAPDEKNHRVSIQLNWVKTCSDSGSGASKSGSTKSNSNTR